MKPAHIAANTAAIALFCVLALIPLSSAYRSVDFWISAAGGVALGAGIAIAAARLHWRTLSVAGAAVAAYFLFGGVLVFRGDAFLGFLPGLDVLSALALGAVRVWKQALTMQTPFVGFAELAVAPFLSALLCSVIAVSLALRLRRFGFALIPVLVLLAFSVLYSTFDPILPAVLGAVLGALALAWAVWRGRLTRRAGVAGDLASVGTADIDSAATPSRTPERRASAAIAGVLVGSVAVGAALVAIAPVDRWVLRDHVLPPLELHDYASPLTSFRKWVTDGEEAKLFTITGLPEGATVRLASLDAYDGIVYQVSGAGGAGSGSFARVGREIESAVEGESRRISVEVGDLSSVWMPATGSLTSLTLDRVDPGSRSGDLHYNVATSTAIVTSGLTTGDRYEFDTVIPDRPSENELAKATLATVSLPAPEQVPDALIAALDEATAEAETPIQQVRAVEAFLQTSGFFSHGLEGQVASRSGHGAGREGDLFAGTQMIGDDEQYSVAMSLMLAQLGIPARVVMGFSGDGGAGLAAEASAAENITVTGDQVHAWVEVPFEELGWVAFWPTPSEDRVPMEEVPEQRQKPRAQVAQPPDTPQEPAELPPAPPVEDLEEGEDPLDLAWLWAALRVTGLSLLALAVLLGPSIALAIMKAKRRARRAEAEGAATRLHGGWAELIDTAADLGAGPARGATRREQGAALDARYPESGVALLAARADDAVFGPGDPDQATIETYWADARAASAAIRNAQPWHRRQIARLFPASVLRSLPRTDPAALAQSAGDTVRSLGGRLRERLRGIRPRREANDGGEA